MVPRRSPTLLLALLALGACDALGPDRGNTRIVASRLGSDGAARVLLPAQPLADRDHDDDDDDDDGRPGYPGAVLALVEDLEVVITAVQALPAQYIDHPDAERYWETLTLSAPVRVNLLALPVDAPSGLELLDGDLPPGAYVRMRFLVSESNLVLAAPLRLGRHTFDAGEEIEIHLRDPWVRVPGAYFTVSEDEIATVRLFFDPGATLGQLVVTPDGRLQLTPVIQGRDHDRPWKD